MSRWPRFGCRGTVRPFADGNQTGDTEERADEATDKDFDGVVLAESNDELMLGQIEMPPIRIGDFGDARRYEGAIHQMKAARNARPQQDGLNARDDIGSFPAVRARSQINQHADGAAGQEKGSHAVCILNDPWRTRRGHR